MPYRIIFNKQTFKWFIAIIIHFIIILGLTFMDLFFRTSLLKENTSTAVYFAVVSLYLSLIFNLIIIQFNFFVLCINARFKVLNQNLQFYFEMVNKNVSIDTSQQIRMIARLHIKLTDAIELMNDLFSVELIPTFFNIFFCNVLLVYNLYLVLHFDQREDLLKLGVRSAWNTYNTLFGLCAIHSAYATKTIAKKSFIIAFDTRTASTNQKVLLRVRLASKFSFL